jgi:adenylate cyclase
MDDGRPEPRTFAELDELLLGARRVYTRDEFAARATVGIERARGYWRALGFANVGDDEVAFTDDDLVALDRLRGLIDDGTIDEDLALALTRALGHTMTRLAGWVVDAVLDELWPEDGGEIAIDDAYAAAEALTPALEELMAYAWRRELSAAVARVAAQPVGEAPSQCVGFADIVGFTRLARQLSEDDLAALVARFEEQATDLVAAHGGRMVKTLGDEVLFTAPDEGSCAQIALGLQAVIAGAEEGLADGAPVQLRIGLATGPVLTLRGDVFGTTVNRASRLTSLARPGAVLVDEHTAEGLRDDARFLLVPMRDRKIRGLGSVGVAALRAAPPVQVAEPAEA